MARPNRAQLLAAGRGVKNQDTDEDAFQATGATNSNTGDIRGASVYRRGPGTITLYDANGRSWEVPEQNLKICLGNGLYTECPVCGTEHTERGANECPAKARIKYAPCPVCGKREYDEGFRAREDQDTNDPDAVEVELVRSTAESRIKAKVLQHMEVYHYQEFQRQKMSEVAS